MKLGIIGAMNEEVIGIKELMTDIKEETSANRSYFTGKINSLDVTLVVSRCGKVAAASTATMLIDKYKCDLILFTGVAGAVSTQLNIGDIVIAEKLYQHDMNGEPFFKKHVIPLTGKMFFHSDAKHIEMALQAIKRFIARFDHTKIPLEHFKIQNPTIHTGIIASGDQFIRNVLQYDGLHLENETVLAVEMEGAAVAQVCDEHQVPFIVIRIISDRADHSAHIDFPAFIREIAAHYAECIVKEFVRFCETA